MCDCCKKIIVQTTNNVSTTSVDFKSIKDVTVLKVTNYNFNYTTLEDGDYILQLELDITMNGIGSAQNDLTSQLIKNNILQSLNLNLEHRLNLGFELKEGYETQYTHNCKITGVTAGDTIGFQLSVTDTSVLINNGSITVIKI